MITIEQQTDVFGGHYRDVQLCSTQEAITIKQSSYTVVVSRKTIPELIKNLQEFMPPDPIKEPVTTVIRDYSPYKDETYVDIELRASGKDLLMMSSIDCNDIRYGFNMDTVPELIEALQRFLPPKSQIKGKVSVDLRNDGMLRLSWGHESFSITRRNAEEISKAMQYLLTDSVTENPKLENPKLENPKLENPKLENPKLEVGARVYVELKDSKVVPGTVKQFLRNQADEVRVVVANPQTSIAVVPLNKVWWSV